jgi:DNA-binding transcriptional MerR regulator
MTATAEAVTPDEAHWRYRMKDLCEATGLPRQAIHFYIQQELLPPGRKTGRNMAWYTDEHIERLHLIKKLQHEQFLPLKAKDER